VRFCMLDASMSQPVIWFKKGPLALEF